MASSWSAFFQSAGLKKPTIPTPPPAAPSAALAPAPTSVSAPAPSLPAPPPPARLNTHLDPHLPWVESARPRRLDQVVGQRNVTRVLSSDMLLSLPGMLFVGPPGTGKTSTAEALAHELFPYDEVFRERVLELNASDERGISAVRDIILPRVRTAVSDSWKLKNEQVVRIPAINIIILDEMDDMTQEAQAALRRIMEVYASTTRFICICNLVSRIDTAIVSRVWKQYFQPLRIEETDQRLRSVAERLHVTLPNHVHAQVAQYARGNLRNALLLLQSVSTLYRAQPEQWQTDADSEPRVRALVGLAPAALVDQLVECMLAPTRAERRRKQPQWKQTVTELYRGGYAATLVLRQLSDALWDSAVTPTSSPVTDTYVAHWTERIAEADRALCDGTDPYLQWIALFHDLDIPTAVALATPTSLLQVR